MCQNCTAPQKLDVQLKLMINSLMDARKLDRQIDIDSGRSQSFSDKALFQYAYIVRSNVSDKCVRLQNGGHSIVGSLYNYGMTIAATLLQPFQFIHVHALHCD